MQGTGSLPRGPGGEEPPGRVRGETLTMRNEEAIIMEVIVKYNGDIFRTAEVLGGTAEILSCHYAIVTIDEKRLRELYAFTEVEDIEVSKQLFINISYQLSSSCISSVQQQGGYDLRGRGTIAAVIDSGIDYTHFDFRNEDGTTRILSLWDQTIEGTPPDGFYEGSEYTREEINNALLSNNPLSFIPTRDYIGHGTAVAGIAAGNGNASGGQNTGVAPLADLIVVKVGNRSGDGFALSTDIMRAVRYVIDKARLYSKPAAVNLSFGMNNGAHNGRSLFEEFLTDMAEEWKLVIVTPTGNEGSAGHHYAGNISASQVKEVSFFTASGIERFYLTLWKNFADNYAVELILPNGVSTGVVNIENQRKQVLLGNLRITILYGQPTRYSADQEIFIDVRAETGTINSGAWTLRLIPGTIVDGSFNLWLPTVEEVTAKTYFSEPTFQNTLTLPSTAEKVIRVAGYNDRLGSIAPFSGTGSLNGTGILPDVAAPAVNITAPQVGGGYDTFTGTSFAAPFVTGAALLLMEWAIVNKNAPFFYGERLRAFLRLGAARSTGMQYPNPTFGYGRLCLRQSLEALIRYTEGQNFS